MINSWYRRMELQSSERGQPVPVLHDPSDFEAFVRGRREGPVRLPHGRTPPQADVRGVARGGLVRSMRHLGSAPATWARRLYRFAAHALGDRVRLARIHREVRHGMLDIASATATSVEASHERRAAIQQELAVLQRLLPGLPLRCRRIYLLNRIEGMSYTEIADHCGISVKAVEKHISRAVRLLRERLTPFNREITRP